MHLCHECENATTSVVGATYLLTIFLHLQPQIIKCSGVCQLSRHVHLLGWTRHQPSSVLHHFETVMWVQKIDINYTDVLVIVTLTPDLCPQTLPRRRRRTRRSRLRLWDSRIHPQVHLRFFSICGSGLSVVTWSLYNRGLANLLGWFLQKHYHGTCRKIIKSNQTMNKICVLKAQQYLALYQKTLTTEKWRHSPILWLTDN